MFTNITTNQTIYATFEINKYQINATSEENGSISSPGIIITEYSESITYYFYPNTNFTVQNVTVDGIPLGSLTNYTFTNIATNFIRVITLMKS